MSYVEEFPFEFTRKQISISFFFFFCCTNFWSLKHVFDRLQRANDDDDIILELIKENCLAKTRSAANNRSERNHIYTDLFVYCSSFFFFYKLNSW